jgi:hypothetical protein
MWFNLCAGRKHVCGACGQVFMLDNPDWHPVDIESVPESERAKGKSSAATASQKAMHCVRCM